MPKPATSHRARRIIDRHKHMKTDKDPWLNMYQLIGEYVMIRKQHFTDMVNPGEFQTDKLNDDTAPNANFLMASSLIGALWPNGAKSFQITMPLGMEEELDGETEEVKSYYEWATKTMAEHMDNPKAGLLLALEEYMLDQGAFGISGIMTEDNDDLTLPITYKAIDAKVMTIDEGENGFVDTLYVEREYTLRQLVQKYGYENISAEWQKKYDEGDCKTKVKVLQAIEPRMEKDPYGFGVKNMAYASIHIDLKTEKILKESGFVESPFAVARFWKAMGEKYGRSPAMNALPSILEANALGEAWVIAVEKTLDPSLLVMEDSAMGNGTIDTSPGGVTVVSASGRISSNQKPIEPLFLVGDLRWTAERRAELVEIIKNHFFQDRLMDLNNEQRMTLGEANIRDSLRGQTLNTTYSRQMNETLVPTIERSFNILNRKGLLGVKPGSRQEQALIDAGVPYRYIPEPVLRRMEKGQEVYKIHFVSPATRIMQAEELKGINQTAAFVTQVQPVKPEALDNVDMDWTIRRVRELTGAPPEMMASSDKMKKDRSDRTQATQAVVENQANREGSETARNMAQAIGTLNQQQGAA